MVSECRASVENLINLAAKVSSAIKGDRRVLLAYLIGSQASAKTRKHSDVDLALIVDGSIDVLGDVRANVAHVLGIFEDKVDLADLSKADLYFKYKAVTQGLKLLDRGDYDRRIRRELSSRLPEANLMEDLEIREWLNSPSAIDPKIVKRRLDAAKREASFLQKELLSISTKQLLSSEVHLRALERSFQISVESMLDVCRHIVSMEGWGPAKHYKEYVDLLSSNKVIDEGLGKRLARAVEWRNVIVHRYLEVDHRKLLGDAKKLRALVDKFRASIAEFLRR